MCQRYRVQNKEYFTTVLSHGLTQLICTRCFTVWMSLDRFKLFFFTSRQKSEVGHPVSKVTRAEDVMHLAVVACGNRLDETLNMVKSALLFSIKKIKFHIFAEEDLAEQFEKGVRACPLILSSLL